MGTQLQIFAAQHTAAVGEYSARSVYREVALANVYRRELEGLLGSAEDAWEEWAEARAAAKLERRPAVLRERMVDAVVTARRVAALVEAGVMS